MSLLHTEFLEYVSRFCGLDVEAIGSFFAPKKPTSGSYPTSPTITGTSFSRHLAGADGIPIMTYATDLPTAAQGASTVGVVVDGETLERGSSRLAYYVLLAATKLRLIDARLLTLKDLQKTVVPFNGQSITEATGTISSGDNTGFGGFETSTIPATPAGTTSSYAMITGFLDLNITDPTATDGDTSRLNSSHTLQVNYGAGWRDLIKLDPAAGNFSIRVITADDNVTSLSLSALTDHGPVHFAPRYNNYEARGYRTAMVTIPANRKLLWRVIRGVSGPQNSAWTVSIQVEAVLANNIAAGWTTLTP